MNLQYQTNFDDINGGIKNQILLQQNHYIFIPVVYKPGVSQTYEEKIQDMFSSDLLAYYPLSETGGSSITDISGNNNHGSVIGSIQYGGRGIGVFPASNSYINIPTTLVNQNIDEFSVMFFISSTNEVITENLIPFIFYRDASNVINMTRGRTTGNYASYYKAGGTLNYIRIGSIQHTYPLHITITYSSTRGMKVFVNGTPSQSSPALQNFDGLITYARIGGNGGASGWQGYIHNFAIIGREVTQYEAKSAAEFDNIVINTQIIAEGDSRTDGSAWVAEVHESIYDNQIIAGYSIFAKSGSTLGTLESRASELDEILVEDANNILIVWAGVNNYTWTADAIHNAIAAYCSARKTAGWTVVVSTEIDAQIDKVMPYHWHETTYPNLNILIRENWPSYADALVDLGANTHLQDATDSVYFYDKLHLTQEGQNVVASVMIPVINSVINSKK